MSEKGWIKLHRSVQHCFLWKDKPFAKGQAWIDLLMLANYENKKGESQGRVVTYHRGVVHVPIMELADRWGWNRKKVARFLQLLESDQMVSVNSTTHGTTITIVNYDNFQDSGSTDVQQSNNQSPTSVQPVSITKKEKKEKEIKNIDIRHKYGTYKNVLFTDEQYQKLIAEFPSDYQERIERLSEYIASTGKSYKDHLATIRSWARKDTAKTPVKKTNQFTNHEQRSFDQYADFIAKLEGG